MHLNSKPTNTDSESGEIDFHKLFYSLLERKWVMLGCLAAMLFLGVVYIVITPKTYSATTSVQVEQEESKFVNIEDINTEDLKQAEILKTIETNLTSSSLLLGVIDTLKLTPVQLGLKPKRDGTAYTDIELVGALDRNVSAKLVRGTRLINITASNTSPALAQTIANEIVKEYARIITADRVGLSGEANKFLLEESDILKHQVQIAEGEAQEFKDQHPGVALEDSHDFVDQKLLALINKLNDSKQELFKAESDAAQAKRILTSPDSPDTITQLLAIPSVAGNPAVLQLQKSVADAQAALDQLSKRYRAKHPTYIQAQAQLAGLQDQLRLTTLQSAQGLGSAADAARLTEGRFEADLKVMEQEKLAGDKVSIPYSALSREVDANRELYDGVRMRLKETEVTRDIGSSDVRIANPAMLPLTPSKPKKLLVLIASIFGGFMLGSCVCFVLSVADTSFKSVDAAELALGIPALAAVPEIPKQPSDKRFLITEDPAGAIAEAFRTLRTSLSIESGETERNIILFTSAVPSEGKSFCASNYAISVAQLGRPTLLIDADLRLPTVAKTLLALHPKLGVNTVLTGESTLDEAIREVPDIPNLHVLPAGGRVSNPAELLAGPPLAKLLNEAAARYDWIVIDSSPVHAVSDTLLLIKHVKSVCFVIHAGKTPARAIQRACDLVENAGTRPTGIVLNHIAPRNQSYYYYYSGEYGKQVYGSAKAT